MRKQHFLKANHSNQTIRHIISVDTETVQVPQTDGSTVHLLELGWVLYSRRLPKGGWSMPVGMQFKTTDALNDFLDTLVKPKERYIFLAHNWAYDAQVLGTFLELPERGWTMGLGIIDGPPWAVSWRRNNTRLDMLDTMNWWPTSLREIGKSVGLDKGEWESVKNDHERLSEYCRRDAEIPMLAVQQWADWIQDEDLGCFALTAASQAFAAFRHRFMNHPILIDDDSRALELARRAYHGGRTECHRIGVIEEHLTLLDVTSMYPYVMSEQEFPTILRGRWKDLTHAELSTQLEKYCVIADVTLTTESPAYAVVHDDKLVFPIGTFRTVLATPELLRAQERGEINVIHEASFYDRARIFEEYVDYFYGERLKAAAEGDLFHASLYKLMLNSLYGKFGQQGFVWENIEDTNDLNAQCWEVHDLVDGTTHKYRRLGGKIQEQLREGEGRNSHPAIAAHVTAAARIYLWNLFELAGLDNVYYCDTDSLLVNDEGLTRLQAFIDPTRLGALKIEYDMDHAEIHGPKDYIFGDRVKIKGIRKTAGCLTSSAIEVFYNERGHPLDEGMPSPGTVFEQEQFRSMTGALRDGEAAVMRVRPVVKRLRRAYTKGLVLPDGRVLPLNLGPTPTPEPSPPWLPRPPGVSRLPRSASLLGRTLAALASLLPRW